MDADYVRKKEKTFHSFCRIYFMIFFCGGILPVNIDNILLNLSGATTWGMGIAIASAIAVATVSVLIFGYYGDKISEKHLRKRLFIFTSCIWIVSYGLLSISINFHYFLIFFVIAAFGSGAFVPLTYSMIGDFYHPRQRGKRFGVMHLSMTIGSGLGIIIGGLLGTYAGPNGWRYAYCLGFILGLIVVFKYQSSGIVPERGQAEPEFQDLKSDFNYNYKITLNKLSQLFKTKSVAGILIYLLFSGVAVSTLGSWAIFYLTSKINDINAEFYATTIYILAGIGILPGAIIGGKLGDSFYHKGKLKGRVIISYLGLILGILALMAFYLVPFYMASPLELIFSWIFFIAIGFFGFFCTALCAGNIYAIYSEVCVPELRSTANAMNVLMGNIGGIIGNLLLSFIILNDLSLLSYVILLLLTIWLCGTSFWILTYFYISKESKELREIMGEKRKTLDSYLK